MKNKCKNWYDQLPKTIQAIVAVISFVIGWIFPLVLFLPALILSIFARIGFLVSRVRGVHYYCSKDHKSNKGRAVRFMSHKPYQSIKMNLEYNWWKSTPHWEIQFDGGAEDGRSIQIHYWFFGFTVFVSVHNAGPKNWYPKEYWSNGEVRYTGSKDYGFCFHDGCSWFHWNSDTDSSAGTTICLNPIRMIKGYEKITYECHEFKEWIIPMLEGGYSLITIRKDQIRKPAHWFTKVIPRVETIAGYLVPYVGQEVEYGDFLFIEGDDNDPDAVHYYDKYGCYLKVVEIRDDRYLPEGLKFVIHKVPVPIPGKGENSYDCGEDATYSSSGPFSIHQAAALRFMEDCIKSRMKYGGQGWLPGKFKDLGINMIGHQQKV